MRKYPAILLAVLLLLAACSAEIVTQLPDEPVKKDSGSVFVEAVSGNQIRVGFTPVAFADSYSYVLGTEETKTPVSSYEMIDGNVSFVVESDMKGTITIYAEKTGEEPVRIASQDFDLSIAGLVPNVYISARSVDGVTLMLASGADDSITYKVDIHLRDGDFVRTEYLKATEDKAIHVTGLEADNAYTLYVSQSLDGVNYSEANQIDVGTFSQGANQTIEMTISDDVLTATGIIGTVANLYKTDSLSSSSTPVLVLENIQVTDGKATVEAKTSLKSLESGYFYFECNGAYSNVVKYVSPVHLEGVDDPVQENWKSALVAIDFADDVIPSDYRVSVEGANSGASATIVDGGVMISNLDSNSTFTVTLKFTSTETLFSTELAGVSGMTQSFAGTYQWEGKFKGESDTVRFRIIVSDEVREGSTSPYYVYFDTTPEIGDSIINSNDSDGNSYVNQTLRIMPIVDYNVESGGDKNNTVKTDAPGDLADQNKAYLANSSKWNPMSSSSLGQVKSWYISNPDTDSERDKVVTETVSEAGMTANMQTTFEFREAEIDGSIVPVVKFKNKAIGSGAFLINNFLYQNSDSNSPKAFGDTTETEGKYCWYLEKVEEV